MGAFSIRSQIGLRAVDQDRSLVLPPADPEAFDTGVWAGGLRFDHVHDYSYDGLMRSYEQSHMRLGMNRIDLLIIHDLDFWFHATEQKVTAYLNQLFTSGWRALDQLRKHKLIRGIGAGINEVGMMPRFLDMVGLDFFLVALRYTLMEQDVLEAEFPYCERMGVGVVVGGVFNSGITATGPVKGAKYNYADATPEVLAKVEKIQAICKKHKRRWRLPRCNSRSPIRSSPQSFLRHLAGSRCGRTSILSPADPGGLMERPQTGGHGLGEGADSEMRLPPWIGWPSAGDEPGVTRL